MPTAKIFANASGLIASGALLWNEEKHKRAELLGLTIDNQHTAPITMKLYDCFGTTSSRTGATGGAQDPEYLGVSGILSGLLRLQLSVPTGETQKLSEQDCKGIEFLGKALGLADVHTSDCVVIAQYKLK